MYTVLIVEDNEMNRDMLSRRLIRKGFQVLTAEDGQAGMNVAQQMIPDIILMDLSLPIVDGWQATKHLKQQEATKQIPIIVLTAHAMSGDEKRAYEAGCDDFDTKPIDMDRLLTKINTLIN